MKTHCQVVVIGGGVVGAAVLYHLTKLGWSDVVLVERKQLTAGSTWHAAGGFHAMNSDPNIAKLQAYGIGVFKEVQELSGQDVGMHLTGGIQVAATPERWEVICYEHSRQKTFGIESELITPEDIKKLCPIMDTSKIIGGLWDPNEGNIDPNGSTHALAKAARMGGAEIYLKTMVTALEHQADNSWLVRTDQGDIHCEHIVNAAGLWAREVGAMASVHVPIVPLEHHYLISGDIKALEEFDGELPLILDSDGEMYLRQERSGVLLGVYEKNSTPWAIEGTSWEYGESDLLQPRLDDIADALSKGFERYPLVAEAGIRRIVNGPFTFAPDGNPLVGPVRGVTNYWSACGIMAGFSQGCGAALTLAQWMINGEPDGDVFAMDVNRFGEFATETYTIEKAKEFYENRFTLLCPNDEWPAARPSKSSAFYDQLKEANAVFGSSYALEVPLWFANKGSEATELPSFRRSNSHELVGAECHSVRNSVGILDACSYAKYEIVGRDAAQFVDFLSAGKLPKPGQIRMAPLLSQSGKLKGDLTAMCLAPNHFMIIGSGYLQEYHMYWFETNKGNRDISINNLSNDLATISVAGPNSRELLQKLSNKDLSKTAMPFMSMKEMDIGYAPCKVARLSFTGELGYELYIPASYAKATYDLLLKEGKSYGLREFGIRALVSMGMEKAFGAWSREFTPDYTPIMCGFDRFVDYDKGEFIGREKAIEDRLNDPSMRLVPIEIDAIDADAWGYEPIWHKDEYAGFVTSGAYGHTVGRSLALGYLRAEFLSSRDDEFAIHIVDQKRPARILPEAAYDPSGSLMRLS